MKQTFFILNLMIILTSCATINPAPKQPEKIEVQENKKASIIPVTTIDFPYGGQEDNRLNHNTLQNVCTDEHLLFLIRYPLEGMRALKHAYDTSVLYNQDLEKLISLTIESRSGSISPQDYIEEVSLLNDEMEFSITAINPLLTKSVTIDMNSRAIYPLCQSKFKKIMTSKKIDTNNDGCELEQQSAYIEDPYQVRPAINDGLLTEIKLSEKLNELYKIVYDETQGVQKLDESVIQFNQKMEELVNSGLLDRSKQLLEKIVYSFQSTVDVKESCEKFPKK